MGAWPRKRDMCKGDSFWAWLNRMRFCGARRSVRVTGDCYLTVRRTRAGDGVLTDWLGLEAGGKAAFALAFAIDGGHLDLVGSLWLQATDGDHGQACWRQNRKR